jgi:hypothetical protein
MSISTAPGLTLAELRSALRQTDPAALLVPPRILRRVIKRDRDLAGIGLQAPHRHCYVIPRDDLLRIAQPDELGLEDGEDPADLALLFPEPPASVLASRPRSLVLLDHWRLLFHARVHAACRQSGGQGLPGEREVLQRLHAVGPAAFDEARHVLLQESCLFASDGVVPVFEEFAACFLELRFFDPERLPYYFPALFGAGPGHYRHDLLTPMHELLAADLDVSALFAATRLPGSADPSAGRSTATPDPLPEEEGESDRRPPDEGRYRRLTGKAGRASARGNHVRAAILRMRAAVAAPAGMRNAGRQAAREEIERLVGRLQKVLDLDEGEAKAWRGSLLLLLGPAARRRGWLPGFSWTRAARLLYDLQKVCVDRERDLYAVSVAEWVFSLGKIPVRRLLPHQGLALQARHLRAALGRIGRIRLRPSAADALSGQIGTALHRTEEELRRTFRPLIGEALEGVGLEPDNHAEGMARGKVVEELLDVVVERGRLSLGELRDAIARNPLKLSDLTAPPSATPTEGSGLRGLSRRLVYGVVNFFHGDPLLRANRRFAKVLGGVYRRGEVYLRLMQRGSSLAFGTMVGRFLTRYVAVPFGGAYFLLEGLHHLIGPLLALAGSSSDGESAGGAARTHDPLQLLTGKYAVLFVGFFLLGLLYVPRFRSLVADLLRLFWKGIRALFFDLPAWLVRVPILHRALQSRAFFFFYQFGAKPLLWAALTFLVVRLAGLDPRPAALLGLAVFLLFAALLNTRLGVRIEEAWGDGMVRTWDLFRQDIVPGLVRLTLYLFRRFLDWVERVLYSVDEWLRFRGGEGRLAFAGKFVLGALWAGVSYVIRFAVNLLIEPQINPIKHFPVVTVSHKLILALVPSVAFLLHQRFGIAEAEATVAVLTVAWAIPGVFGFLAWELKENWRLYRATRPVVLKPVTVGSHGETVLRLLRPGFHSGTLPKRYARLRKAVGTAAHKHLHELDHIGQGILHFFRRDLLAWLTHSRGWGDGPLPAAGRLQLGTNQVRVELLCPERGGGVWLEFRLHGGLLTARLGPEGPRPWTAGLSPEQLGVLHDALAGFYKKAGVDLVEEHLAAHLPAGTAHDVTERGVLVWRGQSPALYPFPPEARWEAQGVGSVTQALRHSGTQALRWAVLSAEEVMFKGKEVRWEAWVDVWERDAAGKGHEPPLLGEVKLIQG